MSLLEQLLTLYQVDSQVRGLQSRLDSARRYLDAQQRKLDAVLQQKNELETRRRQLRAKIAGFENEVKATDERMAKLREDLNRASTNKQYSALLSELNTLKEQKSQHETAELEEMERAEEVETTLGTIETEIAELTRLRDHAKKQYDEREGEVGERLDELKRERDEAASCVPDEERGLFMALANQYEGEAMAPVEEVDRRRHEYACGACNMHLPLNAISSLLVGQDTLVRCPACHRILYLQEKTRGALAKN